MINEDVLKPISKEEFKKQMSEKIKRYNFLKKRFKELNIIYATVDYNANSLKHDMKMATSEAEYARIIYHFDNKLSLMSNIVKCCEEINLDFDKIAKQMDKDKENYEKSHFKQLTTKNLIDKQR